MERTWTDRKLGQHDLGNLKGRVTVCEVNRQTLSYVAGYVSKKLNVGGDTSGRKVLFIDPEKEGDTGRWISAAYEQADPSTGEMLILRPEFTLMSRGSGRYTKGGGGIGSSFVERYKDTDLQQDFLVRNGRKFPMPRYFVKRRLDLLLVEQGPEAVKAEKARRSQLAREQAALRAADNTPDRRAVREEVQFLKTKSLARADASLARLYDRSTKE
jgi:hypothetical protein